MKLFMEINPTLFDECSADYTESQNTAGQREAARQQKWAQLEEQARRNLSKMTINGSKINSSTRTKVNPPAKIDEIDPAAQDNQQRLDALKLQDDGSNGGKDTAKSSSTAEGVIPVSMQ